MAKKAVELKVGIVVIAAVVMLVVTILWIQGFQFSQHYNTVKVICDDVGGLKKGDMVSVSGVTKGKVKDVMLVDGKVETRIIIESDATLYTDASFIIKNYGLMGERYVFIDPGKSGTPMDFSQIQKGSTDAGTSELIGLFGETMRDVQKILSDIRKTIASESNLNNITELAASLNNLSNRLNEFFLDNKGAIKATFTNIEQVSGKLVNLVDSNASRIDTTLANFAAASTSLKNLTDSLDAITSSLKNILTGIEEGEGTLGLLGTDETMYQDIKRMVRQIDMIIEDIRRDPGKYLNIEMKIF